MASFWHLKRLSQFFSAPSSCIIIIFIFCLFYIFTTCLFYLLLILHLFYVFTFYICIVYYVPVEGQEELLKLKDNLPLQLTSIFLCEVDDVPLAHQPKVNKDVG